MIKLKLTQQAADCLAYLAGSYYEDDLSATIVELTGEWLDRENKKRTEYMRLIRGSYTEWVEENKG
jgi:hypothetical protein